MPHHLNKIFQPKTIAAIGASDREGSVGNALIKNLLQGSFSGQIYPVNPKHSTIQGIKSYSSIGKIPVQIDLAVIATPARVVPKVVKQCGEAGVKGLVIISAGFIEVGERGQAMYQQIRATIRQYNMRVMGPNCLGFINTSIGLNASFAASGARTGKMAFISQSGALCTAILDWSNDQSVGFSHFVSIGSMVDIGFHDLIDYFGTDPNTSSILIYLESLQNPRCFMSAARAFARYKPIIVLKGGKSVEGAKASLSHTGSLAGNEAVFRTAFQRAGVLQVDTIQQLFHCAKALAMQARPTGNRLAIVTNAGGPGILATDYLTNKGGVLASLSESTIASLDGFLPAHWSHSNPLDVLGDADAETYCKAVALCAKDANVDGILAILTVQAMTDPVAIAEGLKLEKISVPILTCWMGETQVAVGREVLEEARIPNYRYPENAVEVFLKIHQYVHNLKLLQETPPNIPQAWHPQKKEARSLIDQVLKAGRSQLTETEAKQLLTYYEIPIPEGKVVQTVEEAIACAHALGYPVVIKIDSPAIVHKTDVGGVVLDLDSDQKVEAAFEEIRNRHETHHPEAAFTGVRVEKMISKRYELHIGAKKDPIFGPVIAFGSGGILVEYFKDIGMGLPPLNMALALRIIEKTKAYAWLKGVRGVPGVDVEMIQFLLVKFAYLVMDFPEIQEIDINPFAVDEEGGVALDAHIILDHTLPKGHQQPYDHLVISPYPMHLQREVIMKNGQKALLRPIRSEDEALEAEMFTKLSKQSIYLRFFGYRPRVNHDTLVRFTQIDYDREMAIIAIVEEEGSPQMAGVVRIISDPWKETAEYAIVVADPWQGQGLGRALTEFILEIAEEMGIKKVYAEVLDVNQGMSYILEKMGFSKRKDEMGVNYFELTMEGAS